MENQCHAPIILVSGYGENYISATKYLGQERGANILGSLAKPGSFDEFEKALKKALPEGGVGQASVRSR